MGMFTGDTAVEGSSFVVKSRQNYPALKIEKRLREVEGTALPFIFQRANKPEDSIHMLQYFV